MTLAVIILAKNEEYNIAAVIENARQCTDEILVIDSGSTDRTVELAERHGAKVFYRAWDNDFSAQRNFALSKTAADWVLYVDADERLTAQTISHIKKILAQEELKFQYKVKRKTTAFGVTFNHGALKPDYILRMFPRESVEWTGKVHEHPNCALEVRKLEGYLEHNTYRNWAQWERKMAQYSSIWAESSHARGKRTSRAGAFLHGAAGFLKMYFLQLGFLDGWYGLYSCLNYGWYTQMKYLKLLELG